MARDRDNPVTCWWLWTGDEWAEDPSNPHNCPPDQSCAPPTESGAYIGQEDTTICEGP